MKTSATVAISATSTSVQSDGIKSINHTTSAADFMAHATIGPEFRQLLILYGRATDLSNDMYDFYLRTQSSAKVDADCSAADIAEKLTAKINDVCAELLEQISDAICDKANHKISGNDNCDFEL